ncbi:hypothetical protein M3G03_09700 [Aestuariimicrobium sp. p3-SID1156]|uniref:hypothetical protein n=1 Tax=Aestuariimicrobium sp. p3-SID1156 TaxID=2916038 RepID=UPI00223B8B24|nr:hypothetical protein [Aestuariimicrobium sp. p3-SID1156]MCT1459806.1 hypothetical protein [Aestuariimicrobium sp. p3-SID1156]
MSNNAAPWVRARGMGRLLAQETNISDVVQFLSDRDPSPWADLVGFVPDTVSREARDANHADLLLSSAARRAVIEVKLGHSMSAEQQKKYEVLASQPDLYLAALSFDAGRVDADAARWRFLCLSDFVGAWEDSSDESARVLAREAAAVLRSWDNSIARVFARRGAEDSQPLSSLDQKFFARVVTRRVASDIAERGRRAWAGVTSGGGLPLVQAWTNVRGETDERAFIAEIRWWETKPGGELRFGVDFKPRPGGVEDEVVRRAAYDLAMSMDADLEYASLKAAITESRPDLATLLRRDRPSRPKSKGDWEPVITHGFANAPLLDGRKNNRQRTAPGFYGDGALRFQAIAEIDFGTATARDLVDLIEVTLTYLTSRQPGS